jgi:RNA polymerase sigma-70 factor (ECF subfamily)
MAAKDPLADPAPLIRRVYAYVAYRIGDGPEAEDVTSETFERALRYRSSYDVRQGAPLPWLIGIARRCVEGYRPLSAQQPLVEVEEVGSGELEASVVERLTLAGAMATLDERSRELVALRYGADLTARQIGALLGLKTNAVEVALHRALQRMRKQLEGQGPTSEGFQVPDPHRTLPSRPGT